MPRLSLWRENHSNDYKFIDKRISEMFTVGGTGVLIHKYLGTPASSGSNDLTKPNYANQSEQNIQDLLFLENRDRVYDKDVYTMRGIYQVADSDFDLTQFGLFLQTGTLFLTFHINDMVKTLGRKIMSGDVIELAHLTDYDALNDVPAALKRFFVVGDCSRASEGFSPTWWPHLWRCKINPLVDSQEYKDILNTIVSSTTGNLTVKDVVSTYDKYVGINDAIIAQAEIDVPSSGYDTSSIYVVPVDTTNQTNGDPMGYTVSGDIDASGSITADRQQYTPEAKVEGYLTGDGTAPNGIPVVSGISFPTNPSIGDYCLRLDYMPNRLFRYDGSRWVKIEDSVRTNLTRGATDNLTQKSSFTHNTSTWVNSQGDVQEERQGLSRGLRPDNL
jgi:hypothetical protein